MKKERVTTRFGSVNCCFVCPHGHPQDDINTGVLALEAANTLDAYAVINNGWRRSDKVDELKGRANCNSTMHCKFPVVKAEFWDPVVNAVTDMMAYGTPPFYFVVVHGVGQAIRKQAPGLDLIVGTGNGDPPRPTCEDWRRDFFIDYCRVGRKWKVYVGKAGGLYSAYSKTNLAQGIARLAKKKIHVLQVEFISDLRDDDKTAIQTGAALGRVLNQVLARGDRKYDRDPKSLATPPEI
jgi:hypothetical protein